MKTQTMDIKKFHEITKDERPIKERMVELKEKMLIFFQDPTLELGTQILHLCVSITNNYLYCSKHIKLKYIIPIEPKPSVVDRFKFDWNDWYKEQSLDERAYRFYCNEFFETTTRILLFKGYEFSEIEKAYHSKCKSNLQLALF